MENRIEGNVLIKDYIESNKVTSRSSEVSIVNKKKFHVAGFSNIR